MTTTRTINAAAAALWASAFVLAGLIITQAGRLPANSAYAETTASRGDYSMFTARSGRGNDQNPDEILLIIDNRDQVLLVYEIDNVHQNRILLRDGARLEAMFQNALR